MANTYNSNERQQLITTTYTPVSFSNPNGATPSRLSISYFNKIMKLSIAPKDESVSGEYASYDNKNSVDVYISITKAKMLSELIAYMRSNEDVHNVCVELKNGLLTISDGSDFGVNTECISIRSADEAGNIKTSTYQTKPDAHRGAYNYNVDDNSYSDKLFPNIELDMIVITLDEYVKAFTYATAATVMEASSWNRDRTNKTIGSIADKVGAQNNFSSSNSKNYNSKTFLSGSNQSSNTDTSVPKGFEASTFDDIANAMKH